MFVACFAIKGGIGIVRSQTLANAQVIHYDPFGSSDLAHQCFDFGYIFLFDVGPHQPFVCVECGFMLDICEALNVESFGALHNLRRRCGVEQVDVDILAMFVRRPREQPTIFWSNRKIWQIVADSPSYEARHVADSQRLIETR